MPQHYSLAFIQLCLSGVPSPLLEIPFNTFKFIWNSYQTSQSLKEQLRALAGAAANLLHVLNESYHSKRISNTTTQLENLQESVTFHCCTHSADFRQIIE